MAAMFVGQQFLQNVLGYSTLASGASMLPAAAAMVIVAPLSARLVESRGARFTLLVGYLFCLLGLLSALLFWKQDIPYWPVCLAFALVGIGVGFAGTPASHSLTGSVPVSRAGMASGTADLQRDLGGAVMQSLLGAVLTAGYVSAFGTAIAAAPQAAQISAAVQTELQKSFASAADVASRYPEYSDQIIAAAKASFLAGELAGLRLRHRHRAAGGRAGVLLLPQAGSGAAVARGVRRRGHPQRGSRCRRVAPGQLNPDRTAYRWLGVLCGGGYAARQQWRPRRQVHARTRRG